MRNLLPFIILALLWGSAPAQQITTFPGRTCATMEHLEHQRQLDPKVDLRMAEIEAHTQQIIAAGGGSRQGALIRIPVVVHVVYNTAAENLSTSQIQSQITVLNEDFRRMNADAGNTPASFLPVAADTEFEFCLATIDPTSNPTTGITRTPTANTSFSVSGNAVKFTAQGGRDAWPRNSYLNIWVCDIGGGILGYAQFPGGSASTDGIVCDYLYFGRGGSAVFPFHLGRTATHEVGHWLNLRHIWGDGGCGVDDGVADTPVSDQPNYGCTATVRCGSLDMVQNYMDYSDDGCMNLFTQGQKTRMQALFNPGGFRVSLLGSMGCGTLTPLYEVNKPQASLSIDAVQGTPYTPAITSHCFNGNGIIAATSNTGALGYDIALVVAPLVPGTDPFSINTPGGQFVNVNVFHPTLVFLNSGTALANLIPWGGNLILPFASPSTSFMSSAQMVKLDPGSPDGFWLSQGCQLDVSTTSGSLPAGPTGDDASVTVDLTSVLCNGAFTYYGTAYTELFVSSNGRVVFGAADSDFGPSQGEISSDNPFLGFWTDLDPSTGGTISITSPATNVVRVFFGSVRYFGTNITVSYSIEFDASTGAITLDGLQGISPNTTGTGTGARQFLGITRGNTGATDPGRMTFGVGGSGVGSSTAALYDYCNATAPSLSCGGAGRLNSLQTGLTRIVFTPTGSGGYSWAGF
jgi:hypothetical protein